MDGDNKRNMILAIALSAIIMLGWQFFIALPQEEARQAAQQQQAAEQAQSGSNEAAQPKIGAEVPAGIQSVADLPKARNDVLDDTARLDIETPRLSGSIALKGARFDDLTLRNYHETVDDDSANIVLLNPVGTEKPYLAEFGWLGQSGDLPTRATVWSADKPALTVNDPVTLSWTNDKGVRFEQVITLDQNYMFTVTQRVVNNAGEPLTVAPYGVISRTGTPKVLGYYILHEGPVGFLGESLKEPKYDDLIDEGVVQPAQKQATTGGWLGITDKYWLTALIPDQSETVQTSFTGDRTNGKNRYQADFLTDAKSVAPGQTLEVTNRLFAGAKETTLLDSYRDNLGIANFDLAVDFGWFYWLTKPIFYGIHFLHGVLGNFGLAILALTFGIKLLFFPLANKSYRSMSKMKLLQPKMVELKERYGDDRQKLNTEMMELYKKEKVNPLSGCLPIMLQIPVFFSLYKVLFVTIEMRHAPFYGWIHDLSAPDPLGLLEGFGMFPWEVPAALAIVNIGVWPVIMGLTMFLQQKLNPAPADPIQAKVFMFMPLMFTFILGGFPAGLVIYWAWNNSLSILQQYVIMRRMGVAIGGGKANTGDSAKS
ncbi:membrane protein insertase YidC [Hwanghaeella grinnelliae]|uniref:Membrane protein insertase YidC n=1 Tax=Hwanghaeella grinnelliae TaxID=2500179 RepID=A0A3S2Z6X9_9PROT|nr:membrane protein insertase YidC [Hwanghaeella grinnelliae]RVU36027.1 membrane protein insertase YidC [Hwanghaeella grinnelliae]